jgi:hypothetical protein
VRVLPRCEWGICPQCVESRWKVVVTVHTLVSALLQACGTHHRATQFLPAHENPSLLRETQQRRNGQPRAGHWSGLATARCGTSLLLLLPYCLLLYSTVHPCPHGWHPLRWDINHWRTGCNQLLLSTAPVSRGWKAGSRQWDHCCAWFVWSAQQWAHSHPPPSTPHSLPVH